MQWNFLPLLHYIVQHHFWTSQWSKIGFLKRIIYISDKLNSERILAGITGQWTKECKWKMHRLHATNPLSKLQSDTIYSSKEFGSLIQFKRQKNPRISAEVFLLDLAHQMHCFIYCCKQRKTACALCTILKLHLISAISWFM